MPAAFSRVKFNAREIALSSDEIRAEVVASRELQNALAYGAADDSGTPFSALLRPLSLVSAAGFTMTLGDGDAFFFFPADTGLTADNSAYEVLRWRSVAALTFATPDGTNPRLDLVCAAPGSADADLVSRNILLDPVARTIAAQNVFKTTNPSSVITVVTGTPGASPVPPAVPAGTVALCEVLIPAAAPNSTTFVMLPRLWRLTPFPWSVLSGIVSGCRLQWDLTADPTTTSSGLVLSGLVHRVLINGEMIEADSLVTIPVVQDATASPFASAAGSTDRPYFIYAVGGRSSPQGTLTALGAVPLAIVESTVAPDFNNGGHPSSGITPPRGSATITGAVYIGLGFVVSGTTRRRACIQTEEWTEIIGGDIGVSVNYTTSGALALPSIASKPSISRRMVATALMNGGGVAAGDQVRLVADRGDGAGASPGGVAAGHYSLMHGGISAAAVGVFFVGTVAFNPLNPTIWAQFNVTGTGSLNVQPKAFEHRVHRIVAST